MDADKVKEIEVEQVNNGFVVKFQVEESYKRQVRDGKYRPVPGEFVDDVRNVYYREVYPTVDALCARLLALFPKKRAKK
jgi:hypothetical protein